MKTMRASVLIGPHETLPDPTSVPSGRDQIQAGDARTALGAETGQGYRPFHRRSGRQGRVRAPRPSARDGSSPPSRHRSVADPGNATPQPGARLRVRRGVAQSGSAPVWGTGGRGFKSRRPDHFHSRNGLRGRSLSRCSSASGLSSSGWAPTLVSASFDPPGHGRPPRVLASSRSRGVPNSIPSPNGVAVRRPVPTCGLGQSGRPSRSHAPCAGS